MMNNVCAFEGNIGKDAEHKSTKNGGDMVTTSLAVYRSKEKTDWINLKAFGSVSKELMKAQKGQKAKVYGRLEIDPYEKDGHKSVWVNLVVEGVTLYDKKEKTVDESTPF